jgi:hypothetical protein
MKIEFKGGKWYLYAKDGKLIGRFGNEQVAKDYMKGIKKSKGKKE